MGSEFIFTDVSAACEILTDLHYSRDEIKTLAAIKTLNQLLYHNPQNRSRIYSAARSRGGVSALLGILRSSQSIPILTDAANCVALLVHDNSRAVEQLVSDGILSTLLPLLYPRSEKRITATDTVGGTSVEEVLDFPYPLTSPLAWSREWLPVYEVVLATIRKLTYHSSALQTTFAEGGGIRLIIELSSSPEFIASASKFSSAARDKLVQLTLGKKFITRAVSAPKSLQKTILKSFPALLSSSQIPSSPYPCYLVDLMIEEKTWVADELVDSQLVWPSHASFPEGAEPVWTCVGVMCVEDAGHIWCQFCIDRPKPKIEAMALALRDIAPPTEDDRYDADIPDIGELCIAYFDPKYCHTSSCIKMAFWGRCRVSSVEPGVRLRLLSIDYGVTATLPFSHVLPLPHVCKGIPALAIPCKLMGVAPIHVCTVVQENAAGILRNMSFEKTAFRKEIIAFEGVEALLKLAQSCDVGVAEQAIATLLNMAVSEAKEMGERGAIEILLTMVLQDSPHPTLFPLLMGALYTLLAHCPNNQHRLVTQQASSKLSALLIKDYIQGKEREKLMALVKILGGTSPNSRPLKSSMLRNSRQSLSASPPKSVKSRPLTLHIPNSSSKRGKAVYRCLGDQELCEPVDQGSEDEREGGKEREGEGRISGGVVTNLTYTYNSILPFREDDTHDFKDVGSVKDITRGMLQRCICAMVNSGKQCTIYVGVSNDGRVHGVKISRKERDMLGVAIDGIMHNSFSTAIKHNRCKILFVPVVSHSHSPLRVSPNTYVLQLEISGGDVSKREVYAVVRTRDGQKVGECFIRCGKTNVQASPQELRNMLARQESNCHGNEISSLLQNISSLRVTLDQITMASGDNS